MADIFEDIICITNRKLVEIPFLEQIKNICSKKPYALILREKDLKPDEYLALAEKVKKICDEYDIEFIAHFFYEAALKLNTSYVHLPLWKYKEIKENDSIKKQVGVSVHSIEEAIEAQHLGAAYLIVGHIFKTECKKNLEPRGLDFLEKICESVDIPVYAIGGMKLEEKLIDEVKSKGAKKICIMSELMRKNI